MQIYFLTSWELVMSLAFCVFVKFTTLSNKKYMESKNLVSHERISYSAHCFWTFSRIWLINHENKAERQDYKKI